MKKLQARQGFTLIELLLVMAIIAILSSAILVAISGQRERARSARVLSEVSAMIQPMMMCWADGGHIVGLQIGLDVCTLSPNYGKWPDVGQQNWDYQHGAVITWAGGASSSNWHFQVRSQNWIGGLQHICCNSTYNRCANMGTSSVCNSTTVLP